MVKSITFFNNGNVMCFDDKGQQIPKFQKPIIQFYCELLEKEGIDPKDVDFTMPDGRKARPFKTESGDWNWEIG